ncbi:hypothetical protein [Hydrogenovibrio marinus]|uniref:Uncharacterized protein n=1 Tax=Hydrogenovibrio marinus TaxID=28885 RepID=A0A066ZNJ0_HYDMR|nr:hypothetical protein [Hydrogenovibrio marinus]KDN95383.1 hypothetical protein EI16_03535 [Hydrogenovibrio marinus]BBN59871.1 hypothetical protein HVMH_1465 [Hydrogenovibrio marinus]
MIFRSILSFPLFFIELVVVTVLYLPSVANATPAFARMEHETCEECHTAYPALNATGRLYKMNGYSFNNMMRGRGFGMNKMANESQFESMMKQFPIAAAITSRPYDKKKSGKKEIRAIHEVELLAGGNFNKVFTYIDIEAEGEDGFGLTTEATSLGYTINPHLHLEAAYAPSFFSDPYDTLSNMRRLSVSNYNVLESSFSGVDGQLRHPRQQFSIFGRLARRLFYDATVGGLTEDKTGQDSTVYLGRLALDITPRLMVGTFGVSGRSEISSTNNKSSQARNFDRFGFDTQADILQVRLTGVYMRAHDQYATSKAKESNVDDYVQAVYFSSNRHWVPLLRYQSSEQNNGTQKTESVIAGLSYYPMENAKGTIEYSEDTSVPAGQIKDNRFTLQFQVAL